MRVGYFAETALHLDIAKLLIASSRKHMPDVPVFQLTRDGTPVPDEGVEAIRIPGDMPMGIRRVKHYGMLEGDWLFLDTDILIREDVSNVFAKPFDVAVASRIGTYMQGTEYAKAMPHNFGVIFSRSPAFWRVALRHLERLPAQYKEWEGEQLVMCEMVKQPQFKTEVLPSRYNFTPKKRDEDVSDVAILHLKGPRKAWMPALAS